MKQPAIYIISNKKNGTIYTGVTTNLISRIYIHKESLNKGFTSKYNCNLLVYYELYASIEEAIKREKQIKSGSRAKKIKLIEAINPNWEDLYSSILF